MTISLDSRSRNLLRTLISQYISEGTPVGSRTLARRSGLDVSPATIRNIMSDLEDQGLVAAPHTSAGRVPTAQGYRVFVDSLLQVEPLDAPAIKTLSSNLLAAHGTQALLSNASELLSAMSQFVGVVTVPKRKAFAFRHIEFLSLDPERILAVIIFTDNEVQNRVLTPSRPYSASELEQIGNYLNQNFAGLTLSEIRARLLLEMKQTRKQMESLLSAAVELSEQALEQGDGEDLLLAGQTRLMGAPDLSNIDRLRALFETFSRKQEMLALLERTIRAQGVRIFIGEETGIAPMDSCTLVSAPYSANGRVLGVLGVIGPTRMAYDRVIPMVQATADLLSQALNRDQPTP